MTAIDEIAEHLKELARGGLRRSLLTGLIFFFELLILLNWLFGITPADLGEELGVSSSEVIAGTQFLLLVAGFVFAAGAIIDAQANGWVMRGVSIGLRTYDEIRKRFDSAPLPARPEAEHEADQATNSKAIRSSGSRPFSMVRMAVLVVVFVVTWPVAVIAFTIRSSMGKGPLFEIPLLVDSEAPYLSESARAAIRRSETATRIVEGLKQPYGDRFGASWQSLLLMLGPLERGWAQRLLGRSRDLESFVSAAFLAAVLPTGFYLYDVTGRLTMSGTLDRRAVLAYCLCTFFCYLLFGTLALTRRTVTEVLEFAALNDLWRQTSDREISRSSKEKDRKNRGRD